MGRIRILSDHVANKIAAGEVVERPASVLKELLENSLDAGASDMRIEIENGGRRLIRIADNGSGMLRDDALLAFERHATSKLRDADDLLAISTLGFRGEALPSIAAVSRLLLETRAADETTGTAVEIAGGKIFRCDEAALPRGTVITVRDLFFNVPARRKFLRTDQTELAHIASLVTHYSLAHSDKSFELRHGPQTLLTVTPVSNIRERVYQIFGAQVIEDLVDLGYTERTLTLASGDDDSGDRVFALRGFVSRPQVQKLNRNSIYLFVNGRLIRDKLLMHALSSAYHNLIPPACYPFALLFLDCDAEEVDVNVHPSKTEVRFRHGSFVHDFVRDAIRDVLIASRPVSAVPQPVSPQPVHQQPAAGLPFSEFTQTIEAQRFDAMPVNSWAPAQSAVPIPDEALPIFDRPRAATPGRLVIPDRHGNMPIASETLESMHSLLDLRPLGQIHNSFIIAAGKDGLWIVDQHVAHERILFEKVLKQRRSGAVERQQLLMPIVLELTSPQLLQYARIADELNAAGLETEPFGNRTIAMKAGPAGVGPAEIEKILFEILEIPESELRSLSLDDIRRNIAASIACQAAIKVNMKLDESKMQWLLGALAETDYPMSCPHGRPVALRYSTRDILKGFHRI
ncbi:MAG TPA: DNA mismatch repair endonuclease MutL [Bryobacteraceae bacterium]|nr:DNA mismatch repair endonuclease MutL [Bryobacteraceae bacterium]